MRKELMQFAQAFIDIPNNEEGKQFIEMCRKYLNRKTYQMRVRTRGKRTEYGRGHMRDLPIKYAERYCLYLDKQKLSPTDKQRMKLEKLYDK